MFKKGQITIFIIIGIIIIVLFGLMAYFVNLKNNSVENDTINLPTEIQPIKQYVESCIETNLQEGISVIGRQGGYYIVPNKSINFLFEDIPYYYIDLEDVSPSISIIQEQISLFLNENAKTCYNNLTVFEEQGFTIDVSNNVIFTTSIVKDEILVKAKIQMNVKKDEFESQIEIFSINTHSKIYQIIQSAYEFINIYEEKPDYICLTCIDEISENYNVNLSVVPHFDPSVFGNDIYWVMITDSEPNDFIYRFVLEIKGQSITSSNFFIDERNELNAYLDYEFEHQIKTADEGFEFSDNTHLFDISSSGNIKFTPTNEDVGQHIIKINAEDILGNTYTKYLTINIENVNNNPQIKYIGYHTAYINQKFIYKVEATDIENQTILFTSEENMLLLNPQTGFINFTPTISQVGDYEINITAVDMSGGYDIEMLYLTIKE